MNHRFIILDTPEKQLGALEEAFREACDHKCEVERPLSLSQLKQKLHRGLPWDLVVVDYELGDGKLRGSKLVQQVHKLCQDIPLVVVAEKGNVDIAAKAIEAGANDFMVRTGHLPGRIQTLLDKIEPHLNLITRNRILQEQNMLLRQAVGHRYKIVGESPQIQQVLQQIERVAHIPRPILITGERGTGKELVARAIHASSGDPGRPLITVNCAAFSDSLLESELFGHEKGSFTGAEHLVHGKFELASGGTLFLDEIGNMPLSFQQKILRVVEYGTFTRVGGSKELEVRTRIIAATNADIKTLMEKGLFLRDLYDRLSFEVIHVPAIRNREGDIDLLARHFLQQFMQEIPALQGKRISRTALNVLNDYAFPGNVRELKNMIERAAYRDSTNEITPVDIGLLPQQRNNIAGDSYQEKVDDFQRSLILDALESAGGNQAKAARSLGLSYHQYRYYLKKYNPTE